MTERERQKNQLPHAGKAAAKSEILPYRIELWEADKGGTIERALARASNATLARAIFTAAQSEYPSRRIISDSSR